jgi:hypothetical protein
MAARCNPSPFDPKPRAIPARGIWNPPLVYYAALEGISFIRGWNFLPGFNPATR